jgi:hypothetical protein
VLDAELGTDSGKNIDNRHPTTRNQQQTATPYNKQPGHFWAQMAHATVIVISGPKKSLDFQGPTLTMALVMDIARLKIITSSAIKTTGTLIVNILSSMQT